MQLLALFSQRAAAARVRTLLVESGVPPDSVLLVDKRVDDFLIDDEASNSHMSFWAHVNALLQSEQEMVALEKQVRRGACLMSVRTPQEQLNAVTEVLKSAGTGVSCYLDRRAISKRASNQRARARRGASSGANSAGHS